MTDSLSVSATISAKSQNFPILLSDLLTDLLIYELYDLAKLFIEGSVPGQTLAKQEEQIFEFNQKHKMVTSLTRAR